MGLNVQASGGGELTKLRRTLSGIGDKGLGQELNRGISRAGRLILPEVKKNAGSMLPSGYGPLMARSLKSRLNSRAGKSSALVTVRIFASGKREERDVARVDRGELRHPVYGRRRKPWVAQRVPAGFVTRARDRMVPVVLEEIDKVVRDVASKITK